MERDEKIFDLYFEKKMKQKDIAKILGISKYIISRTVTRNENYKQEKERRKQENIEKHKQATKRYIYSKREKEYAIRAQLEKEHIQASLELSDKENIGSRAFRKWNLSAYKFSQRKNCYEFDRKLTRSYAIPKFVK